MQWQINRRDGHARIGTFSLNKTSLQTPNFLTYNEQYIDIDQSPIRSLKIGSSIFFKNPNEKESANLSINRYLPLPGDMPLKSYKEAEKLISNNEQIVVFPSDLLYIEQKKISKEIKIAIVSYSSQLLNRQTYATHYLTILRKKLPFDALIFIPGIATPSNLALLCYIGIDLFDLSYTKFAANQNILLYTEGQFNQNNLESNPCMCPNCLSKDVQKMSQLDIEKHNQFMLFAELKHIRNAIIYGRLRELIEIRVRASPQLAAILHLFDSIHYDFFEMETPLYRNVGIRASTIDALWRPEVKRFQRRVINWYEKPRSAKILVLLPCSARKPYSHSKSHKRINSYLKNVRNFGVIHEVIVTSPIGIVPRELEMIYPASSYDISVTGMWNKDEQFLIRRLITEYLKKNLYDHIAIHLSSNMQDFLVDLFPAYSITCLDTPTSEKSLFELVKIVTEECSNYSIIDIDKYRWERVRSLMTFQFGVDIADNLLKGSVIKGRGPQFKIFRDHQQLGMVSLPRGYVSLTLEGGNVLHNAGRYWVAIDNTFKLKGSVFAPGVLDADERIRIGDEVCIIQNDAVQGIGVAQMSGMSMVTAGYGEAVKLRHHADN
jgi:archaeosine synthase